MYSRILSILELKSTFEDSDEKLILKKINHAVLRAYLPISKDERVVQFMFVENGKFLFTHFPGGNFD